jgi:hypothetical protein
MSARTKVPSLLLAALAAFVITPVAQAGAWLLAPGETYTSLQTSVFSADRWRGANDLQPTIDGGGLYEVRNVTASGELGWKKGRSFFYSLPFSSVTRRTGEAGGYNRTETGLSDLTLGVRVKLSQKKSALSLDLGWKAPLGYARDFAPRDSRGRRLTVTGAVGDSSVPAAAQYAPTRGDGQQDLFGTLNYGTPLGKRGFLDLAGGYRYRFEAPADQAILRADLGWWLGSRLMVGGRYAGDLAVGDGDTPGDKVTRHLVGPMLLLRVDDKCDVFAGSFHTAAGENVLHVDQFYVGLAFKVTQLDRLQGWMGSLRRP